MGISLSQQETRLLLSEKGKVSVCYFEVVFCSFLRQDGDTAGGDPGIFKRAGAIAKLSAGRTGPEFYI